MSRYITWFNVIDHRRGYYFLIYFITSKNQIILWHVFLLLAAELTHAVSDARLHKNQFNKTCSVLL